MMVFLVTITSAAGVSELQALDSHPDLLRRTRGGAVLHLNPAFLPKVPTLGHLNRAVVLQAFYLHCKSADEKAYRLSCPVRALRLYLVKSEYIQKSPQLFVSCQAGKEGGVLLSLPYPVG